MSTFTYKLKILWLLLCLVVESLAPARLLILSLAQISHLIVVPFLILRHLIVRKAFLWRTLAIEMSFDNENTYSWLEKVLDSRKRYNDTSRTVHMTAIALKVTLKPRLSVPDFVSKICNKKVQG